MVLIIPSNVYFFGKMSVQIFCSFFSLMKLFFLLTHPSRGLLPPSLYRRRHKAEEGGPHGLLTGAPNQGSEGPLAQPGCSPASA